jgi:hypothetical protein
MKKYILKMWILAIVLLPFMPTNASRKNHLIKRYNSAQAQEYVITIKHLRKSIK